MAHPHTPYIGANCYNRGMNYRTIPWEEWINRNRQNNPVKSHSANLTIADIQRFWSRVNKGTGCWQFVTKTVDNYPRFKQRLAHRISYELYKGTMPKGLTIDHTCYNKFCVKPHHLEAVTAYENSMRWVRRTFPEQGT